MHAYPRRIATTCANTSPHTDRSSRALPERSHVGPISKFRAELGPPKLPNASEFSSTCSAMPCSEAHAEAHSSCALRCGARCQSIHIILNQRTLGHGHRTRQHQRRRRQRQQQHQQPDACDAYGRAGCCRCGSLAIQTRTRCRPASVIVFEPDAHACIGLPILRIPLALVFCIRAGHRANVQTL